MNRREFFKTAGIAAAGCLGLGVVIKQSTQRQKDIITGKATFEEYKRDPIKWVERYGRSPAQTALQDMGRANIDVRQAMLDMHCCGVGGYTTKLERGKVVIKRINPRGIPI